MRSYELTQFGAPLQLTERETPQPAGSEVLLKVRAAGICHSDLHIHEGHYDLGGGKKLTFADRGLSLPVTLGHETVGEIVAVGPAVSGVEPGEARLVYPWIGCGECVVCASGEGQLCLKPRFLGVHRRGGYSDLMLVPHPRYLFDIGAMTPAEAAPYACSGLTAYGALRKLGALVRSRPIVIIGAGGLGLMCLTLLKALGGRGAVVVDVAADKRAAALRAGALAVVDGGALDATKRLAEAIDGPVMAVIDFVGSSATARLGIDALAKGGTYIIVGLFGGDVTLSLPLLPMRAITVRGSYVGSLGEMTELMDLVRGGSVARIPIAIRPLDTVNAALDELRAGRAVGRLVLTP